MSCEVHRTLIISSIQIDVVVHRQLKYNTLPTLRNTIDKYSRLSNCHLRNY